MLRTQLSDLSVRSAASDLICKIIETKTPIIIRDPRTLHIDNIAHTDHIRAIVLLPLVVGREVVAIFALYTHSRHGFDKLEMNLLAELSGDIAFALKNLEREAKLNFLAWFDPLTGLANRNLYLERLSQLAEAASSNGKSIAIVLMDIDRFKIINDTLGKQAGDELLKQISSRMAGSTKEQVWHARLNADTFAMLLPNVKDAGEVAREIELKSLKFFSATYRINDIDLRVSAKFGIALLPEDGTDAETLFRNAEAALKSAKSSKKNYLFHTQEMTERAAELLKLENKLRRAVSQQEFVLHYQAKVGFDFESINEVEALVRWNDPENGLIAPGVFIPLLEETGLILKVGVWALEQAVSDIMRWRAMGLNAPRVAVNVSVLQLREPDFADTVITALTGFAGTEPLLDIEITESMIMDNIKQTRIALKILRDSGVKISIDDFGTGYSSLAYLARLPIDILKIDRNFILGMDQDNESITIVEAIVSLAHSLQLKVVAEGVETEQQAATLRNLNCDQMQGYLHSKPMPFEDIAMNLAKSCAT